MKKEKLRALQALVLMNLIGRVNDEASLEILAYLFTMPKWFKIPEPSKKQEKLLYDIKVTSEFIKLFES